MNLKMMAALIVSMGLMVGCGATPPVSEAVQSPTVARAQSYNASFAQKYVDIALTTYGITATTFGLEQTRANAVASLASGQSTPSALRDSLLNPLVGLNLYWASSDATLQSPENYVLFLWRYYLLRDGNAADRAYWVDQLRSGMTPAQVRDAFINTPEYASRFPNDQFVLSVYRQVLLREPAQFEIDAWAGALSSSVVTRANFIRLALDSAEFSNCQLNESGRYKTFGIFWTGIAATSNSRVAAPLNPLLPGTLPPTFGRGCN